jgi:hypothetical protein
VDDQAQGLLGYGLGTWWAGMGPGESDGDHQGPARVQDLGRQRGRGGGGDQAQGKSQGCQGARLSRLCAACRERGGQPDCQPAVCRPAVAVVADLCALPRSLRKPVRHASVSCGAPSAARAWPSNSRVCALCPQVRELVRQLRPAQGGRESSSVGAASASSPLVACEQLQAVMAEYPDYAKQVRWWCDSTHLCEIPTLRLIQYCSIRQAAVPVVTWIE